MLQLLPYALGAVGALQGYRGARQSGASGLGSILGGALGAFGGYNLGMMAPGAVPYSQLGATYGATVPFLKNLPGQAMCRQFTDVMAGADPRMYKQQPDSSKGSLADILFKRKGEGGEMEYDPLKISALLGGGLYATGAFKQGPVDSYMPTYNLDYADLASQRSYSYIDPTTGEEKKYEKVFIPEANRGDVARLGPYELSKSRFNTGGLAEIKKFNEGGINYLPSKVSHDENDANNYVRASGYVEDGSGNGDKDEDTMLAQLADGEFVTRADGVLGAGIIAGANPNSMKDMREKGAQYFYEQQKRFKRIFDLLEEAHGTNSKKN